MSKAKSQLNRIIASSHLPLNKLVFPDDTSVSNDHNTSQCSSTKKFVRKRENSNSSIKSKKSRFHTQEANEQCSSQHITRNVYQPLFMKCNGSVIKMSDIEKGPKLLILDKDKQAINLQKQYAIKIDKTNTAKKIAKPNQHNVGNVELEAEIQVTKNRVQELEEQNKCLRKELESKKKAFQKEINGVQIRSQQEGESLKKELHRIKGELKAKGKQIKIKEEELTNLKKKNQSLEDQIQLFTQEHNLVCDQLEKMLREQFSTEQQNIHTLRELSLQHQLSSLRKKLEQQKTQKQKQIENQLTQLRQKSISVAQQCRSLQIANRVLNKKVSISAECEDVREQFAAIKKKYMRILYEYEGCKKENVRLRNMINMKHMQKCRVNEPKKMFNDSDSLTLSLDQSK